MNRNLQAIVLGIVAVLILGTLTWWGFERSRDGDDGTPAEVVPALEALTEAGEAILYFPGRRAMLYPEHRTLPAELAGVDRLRLIIEELLLGPTTEGLFPSLPPHTELGNVTLDIDGTFYLDLSSKEEALRGIGSTSELLAVYSLVDTVLLNEPAARSVVLLWNGRQRPSLAGHVDTGRPLTVNRKLIAEGS